MPTKLYRFPSQASQLAPADWWVAPKSEAEFFASRHFLEGGEGGLCIVVRDAKQKAHLHPLPLQFLTTQRHGDRVLS